MLVCSLVLIHIYLRIFITSAYQNSKEDSKKLQSSFQMDNNFVEYQMQSIRIFLKYIPVFVQSFYL